MNRQLWVGWIPGGPGSKVRVLALGGMLLLGAVAAWADGTAPAAAAEPAPNSSAACLECHSDEKLAMKKAGRRISLFVDEKTLAGSAHASLECIDCHEGFNGEDTPHKAKLTPVDCFSCHEKTARKHAFHSRLALDPRPEGDDTGCTGCHGTHAVAAVKKPGFPFAAGAQSAACGRCHEKARAAFEASAHGKALATKEANAPDCLSCHRQAVVPRAPGQVTLAQKLAQTQLCETCHVGKENVAGQALRGPRFVASFDRSVHGAALQRGKVEAANCVDCHGAHEMNRAMAGSARMNKLRIADTCAGCHEKVAQEYAGSIHASALRKGNLDSAACTNCHGEHDIRKHTDPAAPVHKTNLAQQVCAECHASVRLTRKYGLANDTFKTFEDSYHGLAVRGGAVEVVNCASCHGAHAIKSQNDPTSSVHKANLVRTCGECHPGANTRFAVGAVHASEARKDSSPILYWIANLYVILIVVVVGGMALHNLLDFLKKTRHKLAVQKGEALEIPVAHRLYLRMSLHERLQHGALVLSFVALVVTGFMLRYPEAWWVVGIRQVSHRAFELRGLVHRLAGVIMLGAGAWHVWYLACTAPGRKLFLDLLPRWRDVTDPWGVFKYNVGLASEKPAFGRFCYIEKAEYWALVWGTLLMGATGAVLWFENTSMGWFTKLGFDVARTVHFYEAILATLAIIVWHLYFVVFNPDVYPMNLAWLTGRMSEREMMEEHPLQLEEMKAAERAEGFTAADEDPAVPPGQ